ncbi:short-chain dehydrogenase [Vibrio coralliilyticus]|nr:short-chain dehydrogenase [Vibrio coralliilyticus]
MKILVIGATGTIGKAVVEQLSTQHEVIRAGYKGGDVQVDLSSKASIEELFNQVGTLDAIVSTAGAANFVSLNEAKDEDFQLALSNKLMGQVNLVRVGQEHLSDGGSITLTSGVLSRQPMPGSVTLSMVNGALESFTKAAALEVERDIRINVVSPVFVKETMAMMGMDPTSGLSADDTAKAYVASIEGSANGETLDVLDFV